MATDIDYALLSANAYFSQRDPVNRIGIPKNWTLIERLPIAASGFEAAAYRNGRKNGVSSNIPTFCMNGRPRYFRDEATSALDYESERIIQNNMKAICQGRTVIIIAHRLSAVRHANRILVMDHGQIVEAGSHAELLEHEAGHYSRLHRLQHA